MNDEHTFIDPSALQSTDSLPIRTATAELLDLDRVAGHIVGAVEAQYEHCCNQTQSSDFCPFLEAYTEHLDIHVLAGHPAWHPD